MARLAVLDQHDNRILPLGLCRHLLANYDALEFVGAVPCLFEQLETGNDPMATNTRPDLSMLRHHITTRGSVLSADLISLGTSG